MRVEGEWDGRGMWVEDDNAHTHMRTHTHTGGSPSACHLCTGAGCGGEGDVCGACGPSGGGLAHIGGAGAVGGPPCQPHGDTAPAGS